MKKAIKWIVIIFIALMIIGLIFGGGDDEQSSNTTATTTSEEVETSEPSEVQETIPVSAADLLEAYENNEMKADKEYKGKMLKVTGVVTSIDSGISDNAIVQLGSGNEMEFMTISATGDESFDNNAIELNKGETITVVCKSGGEALGFPQLEKCVIQ